ncbi:MAG: metallophosphoesterase [Roseiflexaceae bacterium]|nr:metallophosphoesterase [Roseiflexaceae bacterium]
MVYRFLLLPTLALMLVGCGAVPLALPTTQPSATSQPAPTQAAQLANTPTVGQPTAAATASPPPVTRLAVISDYGTASPNEARVAELVKSWQPDYVLTTGDNNYPAGEASTIDANIGQFYHEFIAPYQGSYGAGATTNRFFPVLGNHDLQTAQGQPYFDYFTLPGNERYYAVDLGPARIYALNSMPGEQDGIAADSIQGRWLQQQLAASAACWNITLMHHPPFSSGLHGSSDWMQWPFADWGADLVLAGHDHSYERIIQQGIPYLVNGLGGGAVYDLGPPVDGSQLQFNQAYGALLIELDRATLRFQFISVDGTVVDDQVLAGGC